LAEASVATALLLATSYISIGSEAVVSKAPVDFSAPPVDAAFTNGLAILKAASGFQEMSADHVFPDWRTNLCMLLGFRIEDGGQPFVRLVELTTLPPSPSTSRSMTNSTGQAEFALTFGAQPNCPTGRVYRLTSPRLPARVRLFDERGHLLQESSQKLSWQFLTNGLASSCRLLAAMPTNSPKSLSPDAEQALTRSVAALVGLFGDSLGADALEELRDHAMGVVRSPNWFKILLDLNLNLNIAPYFEQTKLVPARAGPTNEMFALFPAELQQGKRVLTTVEFVAGSTVGPHFLTAGVRAIRAVHPSKPGHRLLAQVLAVGVTEDWPVSPVHRRRGADAPNLHLPDSAGLFNVSP
jgi:hypothetical protein